MYPVEDDYRYSFLKRSQQRRTRAQWRGSLTENSTPGVPVMSDGHCEGDVVNSGCMAHDCRMAAVSRSVKV